MAEATIVGFVVSKLANIIENEIKFLGGVGEKVKRVQRELTRIQCCLKDAHSKRKGDARVQNWLHELRDVAYRIEDATDTFSLEVEDHRQKDASIVQHLFKKVRNMPKKMYYLPKLGTKLDNILNELEEISKSRVDYGIIALQDIVGEAVILPIRRATFYEVDESEVVGVHTDKNKILKLLRPEDTPRRTVITIVGTGGLGKTTLARMVYTSASAEFAYHIMLSISQQFSLTDLLTKMLRRLKDSEPKHLDEDYLIHELRSELKDKRYLIILDDVWQVDVWNQLQVALPDDKNGSRILMTSRSLDVAESADSRIPPYQLSFLDDKESRELLLKKAFRYQKPDEEWPSGLLELADKLSNKCKRLPLALVVVGGILATKDPSYPAWERVLRTINWHVDGKTCMDVLTMSYEDMPYYLKACFLYLALFPEDYQISARRLIRMWVAEGFIPLQEGKTMEDTAEDYLNELVQRSMVQVSSRHVNGSIKCFQVHDLLRDLAMHEARQENFVMVFSKESDSEMPNKEVRRASFHSFENDALAKNLTYIEYVFHSFDENHALAKNLTYIEYARSLMLFGPYGTTLPNLSKIRLLKVLELEGVNGRYVGHLVKGLDELIHLKYLGLRGCTIPITECSFHRMKALETLDMRGMDDMYNTGPNGLWSIDTLRHVLCDGLMMVPKTTVHLKNLQTLQRVEFLGMSDGKFPLLNNLRKLGVDCSRGECITLTNLLKTLPSLVSLGICADEMPMEIAYPKVLPNYQNLQSLYLGGKWLKTNTLEASLFPPHLVKLTLAASELQQNPMAELGKLESLKKLWLKRDVLSEELRNSGPIFCPAGFPVLQYLKIHRGYSMKGLTVAEGVMRKLTNLTLVVGGVTWGDFKLQLPPELQHVSITLR